MAGFTFLVPEFNFQMALGQWCSAQRSVKKFRKTGYQGWSMKHAFLADMGGFVLHPRFSPTEKWHRFPLDAEQVHYLAINGYVPYSAVKVDPDIIEERRKVDGLLRLIKVCQILWYFVGTIGRALQGLTITLLELATVGFVMCTLGSYFCLFHKPMDTGRPFVLETHATLPEILLNTEDPAANDIIQEILFGPKVSTQKTHLRTPLDFAGRKDWSFTLCWDYGFRILSKLGNHFLDKKRPIVKISDDYFPELSSGADCVAFLGHTGYAAIHIIGWNFKFVTRTEKLLWRVTTLGIMVSILLFWIIHFCWWMLPSAPARGESQAPKRVSRTSTAESPNDKSHPRKTPSLLERLRSMKDSLWSICLPNDPTVDIPLLALVPVLMCCAVYVVSRVYVILEGFISLRALPRMHINLWIGSLGYRIFEGGSPSLVLC